MLVILGDALVTYCDQSGKSGPLKEAVAAYHEAFTERPREKVSLTLGGDAEQPRQRALDTRGARVGVGAARRGRQCLQRCTC